MAVTDLNGPAWILGCCTVASGNEGAKTFALIAQPLARHINAHHNIKTANKVHNALQSASVPVNPPRPSCSSSRLASTVPLQTLHGQHMVLKPRIAALSEPEKKCDLHFYMVAEPLRS